LSGFGGDRLDRVVAIGAGFFVAADQRSEETFKDAEAVLKESEEIQKHLLAQDEVTAGTLDRIEALLDVKPPTMSA
jgi:hypothetical protein